MKLVSDSLVDQAPIAPEFAFGIPDDRDGMALGTNRNPHIAWEGVPVGTRSLVLLCYDPDVPSRADDVNQPGRTVPASLPRVDFFHWVMVDIDPHLPGIAAASCSAAVTPGGKRTPNGPEGSRQGINDYTGFLEGDAQLGGRYFGYDGPCPPWNDEIVHHYYFVLYATDLARCPVEGEFTGAQVRAAIEGHVLAEDRIVGLYTLNPAVSLD
ncbi:YbhB/YbcL family Raf kinase inhibitor-like protein [Acidihalobacter prosperus]|uniref:Phospholipid-binding protein n=1 Tax=Acidihalobacter prosperus TaxID=160660 RepID=A0A1A6C6B8_9GAMM|nr:YbhB/YbcL family Raf kinase inhibitor-like protein [Acidihalobacter prosperus]OBS10112.1 phospholipid-binding protein [Acidihalobacter prosperus]